MAFFFENHPYIDYDFRKDGDTSRVINPLVRYKVNGLVNLRMSNFYEYDVQDGQTAQWIAEKYYGDSTLDWIIHISNNIIDPLYDWPLSSLDLLNFIKSKYGSVPAAQALIHHYEQIITKKNILFDDTIVEERAVEVDLATYNSLAEVDRRAVDSNEYEINLNDNKRRIKIVRKEFVPRFVEEARDIFK